MILWNQDSLWTRSLPVTAAVMEHHLHQKDSDYGFTHVQIYESFNIVLVLLHKIFGQPDRTGNVTELLRWSLELFGVANSGHGTSSFYRKVSTLTDLH